MTTKQCSKCGEVFPLTPAFFHRDKTSRDGFTYTCKTCAKSRSRQHYWHNPEKQRQYSRKWRNNHPEEFRQYLKEWRANNSERFKAAIKQWLDDNKIRNRKTQQQYNAKNPRKIKFIRGAAQGARRAKLKSLPTGLTSLQITNMHTYWGNKCAICGCSASESRTIAIDHWIPISDSRPDNPGHVAWNVLPLCHSIKVVLGETSCNHSKGNKDPIKWLISYLGEQAAAEKLADIEAYFEWTRNAA